MKRSQRYLTAGALTFASASAPARAQTLAATGPEATRLEFRAPGGCSSAEDFAARVRRRSSRIRLETQSAAAARTLRVEISQPKPGAALRGTVRVVEPEGATRTRQLEAPTCEEAVEALSLIATVTLDPDALLGEPEPEPEPPPELPRPTAAPPLTTTLPRLAPAPPSHARVSYRLSFGLSATLLVRMAPAAAPGGTAFAAFELVSRSVLAPQLRLGVTHAQRRALAAPGGEVGFAFTLPTLDVCPIRWGPRRFGFRPCAFVSAGLLEVWGDAPVESTTQRRFYGHGGAAGLAQLHLGEAFEIIAEGRVSLPFVRDHYGFDRAPFFTTPTPGFSASFGAACGFP